MVNNNVQFTSEMNTAVMVLRALLNSSQTKDGMPSKQLLVDYQNINGQSLPLKKFGFDKLDDFLLASNEFTLQKGRDGGTRVLLRPSADSSHIRKLVDQQKTSNTRKNKVAGQRPVLQARRQPIQTQSSRDENKFRSASAFADIYAQLPNRSTKKAIAAAVEQGAQKKSSPGRAATTTNNGNGSNNGSPGKRAITKQNVALRSPQTQPSKQSQQQQQQQQKVSSIQQKVVTSQLSPTASPFKSNSSNTTAANGRQPINARNSNNNNNNNHQNNNNNNMQKNINRTLIMCDPLPSGITPKLIQRPSLNSRLTRHQNTADSEPPTSPIPSNTVVVTTDHANATVAAPSATSTSNAKTNGTRTLNSRLERLQSNETMSSSTVSSRPVTTTPFTPSMATMKTPIESGDSELLRHHRELAQYCMLKGYPEPEYKFYRIKKTRRISCRVQVNNCLYATYPNDFATEAEAKADAARNALAQLQDPNSETKTPICMDNDDEMAIKIHSCIKEMSNGVFKKNIPQIFEDAYGHGLPDNWFDVVMDNPLMFNIEEAVNGHKIIYPNCGETLTEAPRTAATKEEPSVTHDEPDNSVAELRGPANALGRIRSDDLVLPWQEKYWNLYITHPKSTVEVWARLIGPEYSAKMDSLTTDIELSLLTDKKRANRIAEGEIYLVSITECWYRVRVDKHDQQKKRCHCFFIDVGDADWFANDEIYMCDAKFQRFPAQAVCFSLYGLEDFAGNPNAAYQLDELIANKVLIGEILTKTADYVAQEKSKDLQAKIQMELYDTSSQDDVRLNPIILNKICENTREPQLDRKKMNVVYISHVSENADIYCHLQQDRNSLHYINKVIHQLTQMGMDCEKLRAASAIHAQNRGVAQSLYLILDKAEQQWYRATVQWASKSGQMEVCKCIDYGYEKNVDWSNIYRLDVLSAALNKYPGQAIVLRLHDIHKVNASVVARLRGLLLPNTISANTVVPSDASTIVIVVEGSLVPSVNMFKRMLPNNILYRINDTIRLEQELEICSDIILDPEDTFDRANGINTAIQTKTDELSPIKPYPNPPLDQFFNVFVTMASNPTNFIVRSHNDEKTFRVLMDELQNYCRQSNATPTDDQLKSGQFFAALNQDGAWYRVCLEQPLGSSAVVLSCDFGDINVIEVDKLRILPEKFRQLPQLAIRARLHGIQPKNKDWNTNDCTRFQELTVGKSFASEIKSIQDDNQKCTLDLVLIDVSTENDVYLDTILIDEGRAILA